METSHVLNEQEYPDSCEVDLYKTHLNLQEMRRFPFPVFQSQSETKHRTFQTKNNNKNLLEFERWPTV